MMNLPMHLLHCSLLRNSQSQATPAQDISSSIVITWSPNQWM